MSYTKLYSPNRTSQNEPIPNRIQVPNHAGGYAFPVDDWTRLDRFIKLGSSESTYYQQAKNLTRENAGAVLSCWAADPWRTAEAIAKISHEGRAAKQDAGIFALALGAASMDNDEARRAAFAMVPKVCRTASTLFQWFKDCEGLGRGLSSRAMKRVIAAWYRARTTEQLAYQMIKYRSNVGFTHKRAIELAGRGAGDDVSRQALYLWARGKEHNHADLPPIVQAHIQAMDLDVSDTEQNRLLRALIAIHRLPWEAIPTEALTDPNVWRAMVPHLKLTALIRNLATMTSCGAIDPQNWQHVALRLKDDLRAERVHPFSILQALVVYRSGHGVRGGKSWTPVPRIVDALDEAFYAAFENVDPTNKRIMVSLDLSGSMTDQIAGSALSCREASAAMALSTLAIEPNATCYGFTTGPYPSRFDGVYHGKIGCGLTPMQISPRQRLDDVVAYIATQKMGGTDCALPMIEAEKHGWKYDAFVIWTDNETWFGDIHPVQALQSYRKKSGIPAKLIVAAMTATNFSIADPNDGGMLDIAGMDGAVPTLIRDFIQG
jgi:60 kDa SS-A/Ro ribonucleoprotein